MKKLPFLLILLGIAIVLLISSCCDRKECIDSIYEIQLVNFTPQETDSIAVISYQKNTNFTIKVDSFFTSANNGNSIQFLSGNEFNLNLDYKIEFLNIGKVYFLNNFTLVKTVCVDCIPFGKSYYDALGYYYVNGQKQNIPLEIFK